MHRLLSLVVLISYAGLSLGQSIIDIPENTAALRGDDVRLNCSAILTGGNPSPDVLEWKHFFEQETGTRIWISTNSGQPSDTRFQIDRYGDNYDLIVKDVTLAMAGTYTCRLIYADIEAIAEIVVLDNHACLPEIDEPPMAPNPPTVEENTVLVFTCSVSYSGYMAPKLEWWNSRGMAQTEYTLDEDNMIATAVANETATPDMDEEIFECRLFFEGDDGDGTPPRYTDDCKSWYLVEHAPQDIEISPNPDSVEGGILQLYTGDHVNCSSDGRPEPSYFWYEKVTGMSTEDPGPILVITEEMADREEFPVVWVCRASNTVSGNPRETEMEVKMMIELKEPDSGESTGPEPYVVALAVVIPLLAIIAVVIVIGFMYMRRKKQQEGGGGEDKKPPKDYDNYSGPDRDAPDEPGPPSRPPIQTGPGVNPYPAGKPQGGIPVLPMTQQGYPGRVSPGYADLGVKQIGGSGTSSLNTSVASLQVNQFMGDERPPPQQNNKPPPRKTPSPMQQQTPPQRNTPPPLPQGPPRQGPPMQQQGPPRQGPPPQQQGPPRQGPPPQQQGRNGYPNVGYEPGPPPHGPGQQYPQRYSPAQPQGYHPQYLPPAGTDTSV